MTSKSFTSDPDFLRIVKRRVQTYTLSEAIFICENNPMEANALLDIERGVVLRSVGFEGFLPKKKTIHLADLHSLILPPLFDVEVKAYCRSAREVLAMEGGEAHLKGTHVEILFPSSVKRPNPFGGEDYQLMCITSRPCLIQYPDGSLSFGALNGFDVKGIYRKDYFPIHPIIRQGKREMVEESNMVVRMAAPYIFAQLKVLTPRELDITECLGKGCNNPEMAEILGISVFTVETTRRNIRKKVKALFPSLNEVGMAMRLKEMGCI